MAVSGAWGRLLAACVFGILLVAATSESAFSQIALKLVASGFSEPLAFVQDPTNPSVQFVVQKGGRIRVLLNGALQATDFLNLTGTVSTNSERGLLGLAFPPDYADTRRFYVNFTNLQGHTVIARYERSAGNALVADAGSRFDLRWPGGQRFIVQPFANHNGGTLRFGPDGYLYIGMGDGGSGNDPNNAAQTPTTLLGKMLRIDVSVADNDDDGYRVPPNNPFVDNSPIPALDEIWAFGLRNPWKFSFDDPARGGTGGLFIGDVGQSTREEISFAPSGIGGRNFGWRIREGFVASTAVPVLPPAYLPLTSPIHDYPRTVGQSVTGGVVYRGDQLAGSLVGRYFFGDFISGRISPRPGVQRRRGIGHHCHRTHRRARRGFDHRARELDRRRCVRRNHHHRLPWQRAPHRPSRAADAHDVGHRDGRVCSNTPGVHRVVHAMAGAGHRLEPASDDADGLGVRRVGRLARLPRRRRDAGGGDQLHGHVPAATCIAALGGESGLQRRRPWRRVHLRRELGRVEIRVEWPGGTGRRAPGRVGATVDDPARRLQR